MNGRRCARHPSREAVSTCWGCGLPLCERCARRAAGYVYCRRWCLLRGLARTAGTTLRRLARSPVPLPWAIALTAAAAAFLLVSLARHAALLLELAAAAPASPSSSRTRLRTAAHLVRRGRRWALEVRTSPGGTVLVTVDGRPLAVVTADRTGRARLEGLRIRPDVSRVAVVPLAGGGVAAVIVTPTPTPAPTPEPTPTPTATPTPSPTPTPTPVSTPTPYPTNPPPAEVRRPPPTPRGAQLVRPQPTARGRPIPDLELVLDAGPRIALTFDGGSDGNGASEVLDVLARLRLRVTLFLTGRFIEDHPDLVRRAVLEGHEVGNHTMHHPHLTTYGSDRRQRVRPGLSRERFAQELLEVERKFLAVTGRPMAPLWRAPYGEENSLLRRWAADLGYLHVRWSLLDGHSLDSRDWVADEHSPLYEDTHRMVERLLRFPHLNGGIVLMHLASHRHHPAWSQLPELVRRLQVRRLEIVPVTALLRASPTWSPRLAQAERRHRRTVKRLRRGARPHNTAR